MNNMSKNCILIFLLTQSFIFSQESSTTTGRFSSKAEALASAVSQIPYGAVVKKVHFNGSSTKTCKEQTGSYKCKIIWEK